MFATGRAVYAQPQAVWTRETGRWSAWQCGCIFEDRRAASGVRGARANPCPVKPKISHQEPVSQAADTQNTYYLGDNVVFAMFGSKRTMLRGASCLGILATSYQRGRYCFVRAHNARYLQPRGAGAVSCRLPPFGAVLAGVNEERPAVAERCVKMGHVLGRHVGVPSCFSC